MKHFFLIGDLVDLNDKSFSLKSDYILKKPEGDELKICRRFLEAITSGDDFQVTNIYEYKVEETGNAFSRSENPGDWKYTIISYEKEGLQPDRMTSKLIQLSDLDLSTIMFARESQGYGHHPVMAINFLMSTSPTTQLKQINTDQIADFQNLDNSYAKLEKESSGYEFIIKALEDFIDLGLISKVTPFRTLAHFSILELLLTTYNERTIGKSISHQLKKKIALLNNQFSDPIDINDFFPGPDSNTLELVIEKLYKYRNNIAHGNSSDFEKELSLLMERKQEITMFLTRLVKEVLKFSIHNPTLVKDLKEV